MTPEQEKKFEDSFVVYERTPNQSHFVKEIARTFWERCLDANGIGKEVAVVPEGYIRVTIQLGGCEKFSYLSPANMTETLIEHCPDVLMLHMGDVVKEYQKAIKQKNTTVKQSEIKQAKNPAFDDLCKSFESLAYSITKASDKLTEAIERGCEKAEKEKAQVQWIPKEGDAVFVKSSSVPMVGVYERGGVFSGSTIFWVLTDHSNIKPFDASKIGKKWEEI